MQQRERRTSALMKETCIDDAYFMDFPKIAEPRGNLSFIEEETHLPFTVERAYWYNDVPGGEVREGHAYKTQQEVIVPLSGSFEVLLDDGKDQRVFVLNRPDRGLYVPPGIWRQMLNFSTNSLAFLLSSSPYKPGDYIRDYAQFQQMKSI